MEEILTWIKNKNKNGANNNTDSPKNSPKEVKKSEPEDDVDTTKATFLPEEEHRTGCMDGLLSCAKGSQNHEIIANQEGDVFNDK